MFARDLCHSIIRLFLGLLRRSPVVVAVESSEAPLKALIVLSRVDLLSGLVYGSVQDDLASYCKSVSQLRKEGIIWFRYLRAAQLYVL